ncbi:MAG: hypothetical protein FWH10_07415 [Oscillospiraceae bacterium]|nr:hypothetical protein [Oscillospiraceae bacterium]
MSEKEMILLSAASALMLTENLDSDKQNTLGNFLMAVGQNIVSGAAQKALREKKISEVETETKSKTKEGNEQ